MPGSQERQRRRARERFERQRELRREHQRKVRKRAGIVLAAIVVLGLAIGLPLGLSGSSPKSAARSSASPRPTSTTATVTEPATHCTYTKSSSGDVVKTSLPPSVPDSKSAFTATIHTNLGPVTINLLNSKATCAVNSFTHLASANFWNDTQCHRVSDSGGLYMLQCGDPAAKASQNLSRACTSPTLGTGGPGYEFADENLKGAAYPAGTVAMANSGPNTNGSQFFLVFDKTGLPARYTPFGTITSGLDILQNVAKAGTSCSYSAGGGVPKEKVVIKNVTIHKV